jgi:hypothetical protein
MMPVTRRLKRMVHDQRYMFARVPTDGGNRFHVPWVTVSGAYLAIAAFPRRGEVRKVETLLYAVAGNVPGKLGRAAGELTQAARDLASSGVPVDVRRARAGELVRSWIRQQCGDFARAIERATYGPTKNEPIVPPLLGAEKGE